MKQTKDQPPKLSSQLLIKTEYLDIQNERNSKSERRSFKIPEKVKMEYKNQKSQLTNNPTFNQVNISDDQLRDGGILEPNSSVSHNQFSVFQPQSQTLIPQAAAQQAVDQLNKLNYPFQMRLSRDEGERIADTMIEGLEQEIKVIFQVGGQLQGTQVGQLKQNQKEQRNNKQINQQTQSSQIKDNQQQQMMSRSLYFISDQTSVTQQPLTSRAMVQPQNNQIVQNNFPATTRQQNQSTNNINSTKFDEKIKSNKFSQLDQDLQIQGQQMVGECYSFEENDLRNKTQTQRSREYILKQHDFLRNCNAFRFISKNTSILPKKSGEKNLQKNQKVDEEFMNFLKNRLKISLFLVSLFKQRIGKIQHQVLFFYNQEQMCDYLTKLCSISKYDDDMKSLFEAFLQFLWHFSSTNTSHNQQDQFSQPLTSFARYNAIYDHYKLFIYGIKLPLPRIENYQTHRAAFERNLPLLRKILLQLQKKSQKTESCQESAAQSQQRTKDQLDNNDAIFLSQQIDLLGLTPLQLAIQMEYRESVIVCCENGSDPFFKSYPGMLSAIEMAIAKKNESMLKQILFAVQKENHNSWELKLKQMLQSTLQTIPDFSCKMKWEQESSFLLPFLKRWIPQDTYKIFKRGKSVRIDMGLSNLESNSPQVPQQSDKEDGQEEPGDSTYRSTSQNMSNNNASVNNQKILQQQSKNISNSKQKQEQPNGIKQQQSTVTNMINESGKDSKSNSNNSSDKEKWSKGAWSILLKENGELLIIDHNKLTVQNVFSDLSMAKVENKIDELISTKKEIKSWGDTVSETIQTLKATKYQAKVNLIQEQVNYSTNESFLKTIPFKSFATFEDYYKYSLRHSVVPIDYSTNSPPVIDQFIDACSRNPLLNDVSQNTSSKNASTTTTTINSSKTINPDVWLTEETQIKVKHIIPIIQLIGVTTSNFQNLQNLLTLIESTHSNSFPIRIVIPLFLTFNVTVEFQQFDFVPPTQHLFVLDEQIKKRLYSQQSKNIYNSVNHYGIMNNNPLNQYTSEQQKTLKKLYSSLNKYKPQNIKNAGEQAEEEEDDEEDQSILDEASLQFRNILDSKQNQNEENEDLVDVFQDQNNSNKKNKQQIKQDRLINNNSLFNSFSALDSTSTPPKK